MNNKLFSIVVPFYNADDGKLIRCLRSLVHDNSDDYEIILVNDGSNKKISIDTEKFLLSNSKIKYYELDRNSGVSFARNFGIEHSHGRYIMFVDYDDWVNTDLLHKIRKIILKDDKYDLILFSYTKEFKNHHVEVPFERSLYNPYHLGSAWCKFYSHTVIGKHRFNIDLKNAEDVEFNFRVFKDCKNIYFLNDHAYHYEIHNDSAVRKFNTEMINNYEKTLNTIKGEISSSRKEKEGYYNFAAICLLMILINYVYSSQNSDKRESFREINSRDFIIDLYKNTKYLTLRLTRKLPVLLAKRKLFLCVFGIILVKKHQDSM